MGIPGYFGSIRQKYLKRDLKCAFISRKIEDDYDYLYLDINNFLYHMPRSNAAQTIETTIHTIHQLYQSIQPKKLLYLTLDGPGPIGKISVQRERRMQNITPSETKKVSQLEFTPGIQFMDELKEALLQYAKKISPLVEVIVSGVDLPGEAEIKIFSHINSLPSKIGKIAVLGNDSDAILFGLRSSKAFHIEIARFEQSVITMVPIYEIMQGIWSEFPQLTNSKISKLDIINDFVLISLLLGNDYYPRLTNVASFWKFYKQEITRFNRSLWKEAEGTIDIPFMEALEEKRPPIEKFKVPIKSEINNIIAKHKPLKVEYIRSENDGGFQVKAVLDGKVLGEGEGSTFSQASEIAVTNLLLSSKLPGILASEKSSEELINEQIQKISQLCLSMTNIPVESIVLKYIEAILWSMEYYKGNCLNYRFNFPYFMAPTSIHEYLAPNIKPQKNDWKPLSPPEFCLAVIPGEAWRILPQQLQSFVAKTSPIHDLFFTSKGTSRKWALSEIETNVDKIQTAFSNSVAKQRKTTFFSDLPKKLFGRFFFSTLCNKIRH